MIAPPTGVEITPDIAQQAMSNNEEVNRARLLLDLPEQATMQEIKASYKRLIGRWHPDKCSEDIAQSEEMTKQIIAAYELILTYCGRYRYSFAGEEALEQATEEEYWRQRFGGDSWGTPDS